MVLSLSDDQTRLLRCYSQLLFPRQSDAVGGVAQVVREVCGVQAQVERAATLAVRARSSGLHEPDVAQARERVRSVVRTWCMRGTLHLVATEDVGWLLSLLGPIFVAAGRHRLARLGLDEGAAAEGVSAIRDGLADEGPTTREELVEGIRRRGVRIAADSQAGYPSSHLVRRAALEGVICFGPDRDGAETYVLSSDWGVPEYTGSREEALKRLVRRYLAAYGPARPEDLATWSGLSNREAKAAWKLVGGDLAEVRVAGEPAWILAGRSGSTREYAGQVPFVSLLPHFDAYLLAYSNRDLVVAPRYARRVQRGGGWLHPTVIVNGRAVAIWRYNDKEKKPSVVVEPFEEIEPAVEPGLRAEAEDVGRFLGTNPVLTINSPQ
jgi:winged helix DNA-binding protein